MILDRFKSTSIKDKIQAISFLQIILPIVVIGVISCIISNNIIKNQTLLRTRQQFSFVSAQVTDYTDAIFNNTDELLYDKTIHDIIAFDFPIEPHTEDYIRNLIQQKVTHGTNIDAISITINGKNFRTVSKTNSIAKFNTVEYLDVLKTTRKSEDSVYWFTDTDTAPIKTIYLAKIIYNPYTCKEAGFIILQTSSVSLINMMNQYNANDESSIDIIANNKYIYKSDKNILTLNPSQLPDTEDRLIKQSGAYIITHSIQPINWEIVCALDLWSLYKTSFFLILCILLLCLLSATVLTVVSQYINRNITKPLSTLATQIQSWDEDTVFDHPDKNREDEIGVLYRSYSHLTKKINTLITQNYQHQLLQKDIEYRMLQSQIMPHFLFNTLSAINNMALLNDVPQISQMVTALSDTLNNRIGRSGSYVKLSEEIEASDSYIYIQQVRFDNRLRVTKNISPEAKDVLIPHLTIQPIIENAIKYSLETTNEKCIVSITAYVDENDLIVTVSDDGVGIMPDKLEEIKSALSSNAASINGSIGLINVSKRLSLLYGDDYGISINSEPGQFTTITLKYKTDIKLK